MNDDLMHCDLMGSYDLSGSDEEYCDGRMIIAEEKYYMGQLINRIWRCDTCGAEYTEKDIVRAIDEAALDLQLATYGID